MREWILLFFNHQDQASCSLLFVLPFIIQRTCDDDADGFQEKNKSRGRGTLLWLPCLLILMSLLWVFVSCIILILPLFPWLFTHPSSFCFPVMFRGNIKSSSSHILLMLLLRNSSSLNHKKRHFRNEEERSHHWKERRRSQEMRKEREVLYFSPSLFISCWRFSSYSCQFSSRETMSVGSWEVSLSLSLFVGEETGMKNDIDAFGMNKYKKSFDSSLSCVVSSRFFIKEKKWSGREKKRQGWNILQRESCWKRCQR